eukprot:TRINITY_DN6108_c0_g1_i4.p1 TRINITY_DN6108_c0_g1~~TRINITY_DN6108_c0_g1_i4.p1  ORF type:complete len:105 (-),score=3.76 TRINITY_DN6108_c0_g1_i4:47-361(-)
MTCSNRNLSLFYKLFQNLKFSEQVNIRHFAAIPQRYSIERDTSHRDRKLSHLDWAKIYNSSISKAGSFQRLCVLVDENGRKFDHINVATALVQVARLHEGETLG